MDKIWYRNPSKSEVIGCCGGDEKTNDLAEPTKSRTLKNLKNFWHLKFALKRQQMMVHVHVFNNSNHDHIIIMTFDIILK